MQNNVCFAIQKKQFTPLHSPKPEAKYGADNVDGNEVNPIYMPHTFHIDSQH